MIIPQKLIAYLLYPAIGQKGEFGCLEQRSGSSLSGCGDLFFREDEVPPLRLFKEMIQYFTLEASWSPPA